MKVFNLFKRIFKLPKKILIPAILVLILGGYFILRPQSSTSQKLQFTQVKKQDISSVVSSSGTLTGKNAASLKFKSGGKLAYINVKSGDNVSAGKVIAGLDTQDLAINLQQAQNTLRDKQAIVDKTLDDVKDHSSDETFTQKQARTTAQVARDNAYDSVKEAQRAFQDTVLVSPIDGVVTQASVSVPGQNVSSADLIAQIVDFSSLYFDTDIDEADISKVSLNQSSLVTLDAYPDKVFKGVVAEIIPQTRTTSQGATVITVRINLDSTAITPVNGLSGQASIILAETKGALVVPLETVRDDNIVFVQSPQGLKPQTVETGIKSDTDVEIKNGLNEGDRVLLNPPATGTRISQNRNPIQSAIFRVFGGGTRGAGGGTSTNR